MNQARQEPRVSQIIQNLYLNTPNITLSDIAEKTWSDEQFDNMSHYSVSILDANQIITLVHQLKESQSTQICSDDDPYRVLILAVNLQYLGKSIFGSIFNTLLPARGSIFPIQLPEIQQPEVEEGEQAMGPNADLLFNDEVRVPLLAIEGNELEIERDDLTMIKFGCFQSAYLMRMVTKTMQNVQLSWENMRTRFSNFYTANSPANWNPPTDNWLRQFKALISSDRLIIQTWMKCFVAHEMSKAASDPEAGMIRYLATMPFSFAGMHGYKLFFDVKNALKQSNTWLLEEMTCPETVDALQTIHYIICNHAQYPTVQRTPKYKYARLVGPEYFPKLQTKNSTELVYLLISILQLQKNYTNNVQNPENIVGIESLGAIKKAKLRNAARLIVSSAPNANQQYYSGSMRMAMQQEVAVEGQQNQEGEARPVDPLFAD
ncbi:TPA_asm: N [Hepatica betacytorhabdovirus 1]|nr:TPA_asm: N [Hepatica betacytorhabdovirus 1]